MPTKPIISTAECDAPNTGYLRKISNTLYAALLAHAWKCKGKKVVITNGCFDLLHVGHIKFLEAAKAEGDYLIVGVNSDRAVSILKGPNRPINKQGDRMAVVAALESVDLVVLVDAVRVNDFIEAIRPSIWAKGNDYTPDTLDRGEVFAAWQVKAEIALLKMVQGVSTTNVIDTIRQKSEADRPDKPGSRKQPVKARR